MEQYVQMKSSGVPWLLDIPETWGIRVLFQLADQVKNKNKDLSEQNLLSLSYGRIKRKDINSSDGLLPESFDGYNIIEANDIVLRLTDLQNDHTSLRVGQSHERGIITSAYTTLRPSALVWPAYLYYVLHAYDLIKGFYGMGSGVRQGLNYDEVKTIKIPFPSQTEQQAIAAYLDDQVAQIDSIIAEARASIEEYKQWREAIIYETVCKGIFAHTSFRDTGNIWLKSLPSGIKLSRVGLHFELILGKMLCPNQLDANYNLEPYYCAANVHFNGVDETELKQMWFSPDEKTKYLVQRGDLLVVEGGAGAGGCSIAYPSQDTYIQNSIMIVRPRRGMDVRYVKYLLEMLVKRGYVDFVCNKATIPHFTKEKLANTPLPVFPENEVKAMCDHIDEQYKKIDSIIAEKEALISELGSYKQSLIYEVVTGKRKGV